MKEITIADCQQLRERFLKYCDSAEQHQFPMLAMINVRLNATVEALEKAGEVQDQKNARAMFRVVLKVMGEDFSEYKEPLYKNRCLDCDCWDSDMGCMMPTFDKSYACPIEKERFDE